MREESLRSVLLIKAIEEADRTGALITAAERVSASRESRRNAGLAIIPARQGDAQRLDSSAQKMLAERASMLTRGVVARHPFLSTVLSAAGGPPHAALLLIALGVVLGVALSSLDGSQRINVLAPGVVGLVVWNLFVYFLIFFRAITRKGGGGAVQSRPIARLLAHNATSAMLKMIARSASFNAPLAAALKQFAREWTDAARPLLFARASRVIHLSAAAVGAGLIAGLYVRGIALDYMAGWESTFLDASQVRVVLQGLYGPASRLIGISLPDATHIEVMRWHEVGGVLAGGETARPWIHLLAASIALYVILPRLGLAAWSTARVAHWSWRTPLPPSLQPYFRSAFGAVDSSIGRGIVMVVPYAYEIDASTVARLRTLLPAAFGNDLAVDLRAPIAYGDEDDFVRHLPDRGGAIADIIVLVFNLAATAEEENHGALISAVRDWMAANRRQGQLSVLIDEGPYAVRMATQTGRVEERTRAWREFVNARGLTACIIDLSKEVDETDDARVTQLRSGLWQPA